MILSANTESSLRREKENGVKYCGFAVCRRQLVDLIIPAVLSSDIIQLLFPYLASVLVPLLGSVPHIGLLNAVYKQGS